MFSSNVKILLVDDAKGIRNLIKGNLLELGFTNITEAGDGEEAFTILSQCQQENAPIELLLTDLRMPNMDGIQLVRKIRKLPQFARLPILMISADTDKLAIVDAIKAGISDYIIKPLDTNRLQVKLEQVWAKVNK